MSQKKILITVWVVPRYCEDKHEWLKEGDTDPSRCSYFMEGETEAPSGKWVRSGAHRDPASDIPQFLCRILINTQCQIICVRGMTLVLFQGQRQNDRKRQMSVPTWWWRWEQSLEISRNLGLPGEEARLKTHWAQNPPCLSLQFMSCFLRTSHFIPKGI